MSEETIVEAKLTEFLLSIAEEPKKMVAWEENPDSVLDATNLSQAEKALIKSGDAKLIGAAIAEEFSQTSDQDQGSETIIQLLFPINLFISLNGPITYALNMFDQNLASQDITEAMIQIQTAIESEPNLKDEDKIEALEQIKILAEAHKNPEAMKKQVRTALKILRGTIYLLPNTANLVKKSNKLLPIINERFSFS